MKQTLVKLEVTAYIRNEGEKRSRKVIFNYTGKNGVFLPGSKIVIHALPEVHPGTGKTKVIG